MHIALLVQRTCDDDDYNEDDNASYINMTDLVNDGDENVCIDSISSVCHVCCVFVKNA